MKANFGKYAVIDPIEHRFEKEPEWSWTIKPPTSGDELAMQKFMAPTATSSAPMGTREYPPTTMEVCHRELSLTFGGTNIPSDIEKPVAEGGEPVLKVGASLQKIENMLRQMPPEMVMELWEALGEAVPGWGILPKVKPSKDASES